MILESAPNALDRVHGRDFVWQANNFIFLLSHFSNTSSLGKSRGRGVPSLCFVHLLCTVNLTFPIFFLYQAWCWHNGTGMERIFIHGWKISKTDISYTGKCYYFFHLSTSFVNEARVLLACLKKGNPIGGVAQAPLIVFETFFIIFTICWKKGSFPSWKLLQELNQPL